jgi:hypothetical protein
MFSAGDSSPGHRDFLRIFINPMKSHPTVIIQQILNRAHRGSWFNSYQERPSNSSKLILEYILL